MISSSDWSKPDLMKDYLKARERMVRDQLLTRGISDQRVIEAMQTVPRHFFVEDALRAQAYGDFPLVV